MRGANPRPHTFLIIEGGYALLRGGERGCEADG